MNFRSWSFLRLKCHFHTPHTSFWSSFWSIIPWKHRFHYIHNEVGSQAVFPLFQSSSPQMPGLYTAKHPHFYPLPLVYVILSTSCWQFVDNFLKSCLYFPLSDKKSLYFPVFHRVNNRDKLIHIQNHAFCCPHCFSRYPQSYPHYPHIPIPFIPSMWIYRCCLRRVVPATFSSPPQRSLRFVPAGFRQAAQAKFPEFSQPPGNNHDNL